MRLTSVGTRRRNHAVQNARSPRQDRPQHFNARIQMNHRVVRAGGDQPRGYWDILEVDPPHRLVFHDGFANDDGTPNPDMPGMSVRVTIEAIDGGRTRMSIESRFPNTEAMEQILAMGMEEGLTLAVGQIDAILAEGVAA